MPERNKTFKLIGSVKDIVYILAFIVSIGAFLINEGKNREKQTELINQVTELNKFMQGQLILNGKIIMYMEMDQHINSRDRMLSRNKEFGSVKDTLSIHQQQNSIDSLIKGK